MPYTVDDLIRQFRSDVYDRPDVDGEGNPRDTLWSHEDVMHYLRTALSQWAKDTLAVRYNVTLDVAPGKARYYAGREIIEIARAALVLGSDPAARPRPLAQFNLGDACYADDYGMVYLTTYDIENRQGVPRAITRDYDPTYLRLFPIPTEAGFLHLNLVVYPPLAECGMPLPSDNMQDIHLLLLYMKHLAYAKQDADVQDLSRSAEYLQQYRALVRERMYTLDRERRGGGIIRPRW